ncbi:MAG TPA: HU family DNA-binding protein [Planctomycetota bacterium]|nr:HU family DNA-binding protein [Planctomycetota bacterium]
MGGTLTKNDIVRTLAEKYELEIASTRRVVQGTLDMIVDALLKGDKIELRNFGVFEVIERKGRIARNPKSRQEVFIPERKVVKFKPGKVMEEKITTPSMKGGIQPVNDRKKEGTGESPRVPGEGNLP